ncbi:MAG: hypothetical protein ACYSWP_15015 [Planctomycetota bacterium]|jgi:hypothetical protein
MHIDRIVATFLAQVCGTVLRSTTLDMSLDIAADTATKLRQQFPVPVLKAARFVLDLAIDGEADANKRQPMQNNPPQSQSRPTHRQR